jgi:hypothetical protein
MEAFNGEEANSTQYFFVDKKTNSNSERKRIARNKGFRPTEESS